MAEEFAELALEGADKLIDKHFHRVPDKYVDPQTYKPRRMRKGSKDTTSSTESQPRRSSTRHQEYTPRQQQERYRRSPSPPYTSHGTMEHDNGRPGNNANSSPHLQDGPFITPPFTNPVVYSTLPPHQRPEYAPDVSNPYYSSQTIVRDTRDSRDDYSRRPGGQMRRRSSSYHGPRGVAYFDSDSEEERDTRQVALRSDRHGGSHHGQRRQASHSDLHKESLEDKVAKQFSGSKEGMAGGIVGALVGGFVAHKALESRGKSKKGEDAALTLLAAAAGGLAVNSIVDKLEDRKAVNKEEDRKWEKKFDGRDERRERDRDGGRSERDGSGRRDWDRDDRYYR